MISKTTQVQHLRILRIFNNNYKKELVLHKNDRYFNNFFMTVVFPKFLSTSVGCQLFIFS